MKLIHTLKHILYRSLPIALLLFTSCVDDNENERQRSSRLNKKVNDFIVDYMYTSYLWNEHLPSMPTFNSLYNKDTFELAEELIYHDLDRWSSLSDDMDGLLGSIDGNGKTFGYGIVVSKFKSSSNLFAIVKFVYPDSPAERVGLKRGDIITKMNGQDITKDNAIQLYNGDNLTLEISKPTTEKTFETVGEITMQSIGMELNPLIEQKVIEQDGHKVGYLCYSGYQFNSHENLVRCFQDFKSAGITDMVLDLRYNPGGYAITSMYLSSILAPLSAVQSEDIFLNLLWNDNYMNYFASNDDKENIEQRFDSKIPVNLNLPRLYVLTTGGTASASESTIIGLKSHMEVIQIGTKTHGKYCGAILAQSIIDDKGTVDKEIDNWVLMLVIYKFANKDGFTDFSNGLIPQHEVEEDLLTAVPLGDVTDPLLSKALSLITGTPAKVTTKNSTTGDYHLFPELDPKWGMNGMISR